jgi:hypothetical protein
MIDSIHAKQAQQKAKQAQRKANQASAVPAPSGAGASDGRAKRAMIVKKIMRERGVKMIEASKIVKAEGLY